MIRVVFQENVPKNKSSREKVLFVCECGNRFERSWHSYTRGNDRSCGKCRINLANKDFGFLTLDDDISKIEKTSDSLWFKCKCGNRKQIKLKEVLDGVISCGCARNLPKKHHEVLTPECWKERIPELVLNGTERPWSAQSTLQKTFVCGCGREFKKKFYAYKPGKTKCGHCFDIEIIPGSRVGNFIYAGIASSIKTTSVEKDFFTCKCGRTESIRIYNIFHLNQQTCGKCNLHDLNWWQSIKFGRVRPKHPEKLVETPTNSNIVAEWICDCGSEFRRKVSSITSKNSSCGKCRQKGIDWYVNNQKVLESLTSPVRMQDFPTGGPQLLQDIKFISNKALFRCWLCGKVYKCIPNDIIRGFSLSCGCASGQVSRLNSELFQYLNSIGIECSQEVKIGKWPFDVVIPNNKVAIELHGLKWHSNTDSKRRDSRKRDDAISLGWEVITIFEDEWKNKRSIIESILNSKLNKLNHKSVRPSRCKIERISHNESSNFYNEFHYIGSCFASVHYGVFFESKLVACASFRKPTRQTAKYDFELTRMASNPKFKIHGIWSKIIHKFINEFKPNSIVSYSDNRLFSGKVYEKIGFRFDGSVKPDYFWVKNNKRFHKSGLRKISSRHTESETRYSQGYSKIWNYGYKRWVLFKDDYTTEH